MPLQNQFDTIDKAILKRLTDNARISYVQLASELGISNSLVHQRVNKLRQIGAIDKATYSIDPQTLGYQTLAYTRIVVEEAKNIGQIINALKAIEEVIECNNVTGRYALILKVIAIDNSHLRSILYDKIHPIRGVEGTDTIIVFETAFQRNVPIEI